MIRVLSALEQLTESGKDIQVFESVTGEIGVVTTFDEFYIDQVEDAEVLRDFLNTWITKKRSRS
jgi:hypothetical protein